MFRYGYDVQAAMEPWRDKLGDDFENVIARLSDRDRQLEDYLSKTLPQGELGYAQVTADQGAITTVTDLTSLTVTVTVGAGRRIRITGAIRSSNTGANSNLLLIRESTTTLQTSSYVASTATERMPPAVYVFTPTAGSHTYKLTADTGGGTMTMRASSTAPAFIQVEDIGPA